MEVGPLLKKYGIPLGLPMLGIHLDRTLAVSLSRQLVEALRHRIMRGEIQEEEALPASRTLAESLAISRSVVVEAYEQLQAEGYIEGRRGSGCYVAPGVRIQPCLSTPPPPVDPPPESNQAAIAFTTGLPALDLVPWHAWGKALKEAAPRLARSGYGDPEGLPDLREALAAYLYRARGIRVTATDVMVTSGTTQALSLLTGICCNSRRGVVVEDPCHGAMQNLLRVAGIPMHPCPVDPQGLRVDAWPAPEAGLLYVTPSHQFPLGGVLPAPRRAQLSTWARHHGVRILEDDYDSEFRYEGPPLLPLRETDPDSVAFIGTFSKTFSPALRLGYAVLPPGLQADWRIRKHHSDIHNPLVEQAAMADFLASGRMEHHIHRMRKIYATRRNALLEALTSHFKDRVIIQGAAAGLHLVASFPGISFTPECMAHLQTTGVTVTPVSRYAMQQPGAYETCILLGYGHLEVKRIREGVRRLARGLERS